MRAGRKDTIVLIGSIIWLLVLTVAMVYCFYMAATGHGAPLWEKP